MNQILKECVYGRGNRKQFEFIANLSGMNEIEYAVFKGLHDKKPDSVTQDELCLSRSAYEKIEASVRTKLTVAIFECISGYMEVYKEK